jgi:hypothetical protein
LVRFFSLLIYDIDDRDAMKNHSANTSIKFQTMTSAMKPPLPPLPSLLATPQSLVHSHSFSETAHWVIPGLLLQGAQPHIVNNDDNHDTLSNLVHKANCHVFVSLRAECAPQDHAVCIDNGGCRDWEMQDSNQAIQSSSYSYSNHIQTLVQQAKLPSPIFLHYGIQDCQPSPSFQGLIRIVDELSNRILSGEVVYLHCMGGKGRSGLVAACILLKLYPNLKVEEALEYVDLFCGVRQWYKLSMDDDEGEAKEEREMGWWRGRSPETHGQREQVLEFYEWIRRRKEEES